MDQGRRRKKISKRLTKKLTAERLRRGLAPAQRILDSTFAVLDLEATGLSDSDQILEIALVRFTADGTAFDDWSTLVNPARDLGSREARSTHRLQRFATVAHAPRFEQIAGDICMRLQGCVLVAHNLTYDLRMLRAEFERVGVELPELATLCTMRLGAGLGVPDRRLVDACARFGIVPAASHTALDDARACSLLLSVYLMTCLRSGVQNLPEIGVEQPVPAPEAWPSVPEPSGASLVRSQAELLELAELHARAEREFLTRIVHRLPQAADQTEQEYLALVDLVLEDFQVTMEEAQDLQRFAASAGLNEIQTRALHQQYLSNLAEAAWADGVVTDEERRQLELVAKLLSVPATEVAALLDVHRPGE